MRQPSGAILLAVLIVPLGIASLWASHGPARAAEFAPWLAAGWACVAGGLAARRTAPWSRVWLLLLAVGITWLVPDLSNCLNVEPLSHRCIPVNAAPWLVGAADWVWLGLAGHAVIAFPDGRLTRGPLVAAVIAAYVLTLGVAFDAGPTRPLLAALLVGAPIAASRIRRDRDVAAWAPASVAGAALGAAVLLETSAPLALEAGVVSAALALLAGLALVAMTRAALTADRAVELGPAIADVLGDPAFRIAVRAPDGDSWLDPSGRSVAAPSMRGSASTSIVRDGVEIARLLYGESTLADPGIRAAVMTAAELAAHNARLRANLDTQVGSVASSRRRLVDAALREREALGRQVEADVVLPLVRLARSLRAISTDGLPADAVRRLRHAAAELDVARGEVDELARGVYPTSLAERGLAESLRDLASHAPIDVRVEASDDLGGGPDVDATLYFLCAEALANAARHAHAAAARVEIIRVADRMTLVVEDDGVGGADLDRGTGLRGLRDRVEALGGSLALESRPGAGTRLVATIPVGHEAPVLQGSPAHSTFVQAPPQ